MQAQLLPKQKHAVQQIQATRFVTGSHTHTHTHGWTDGGAHSSAAKLQHLLVTGSHSRLMLLQPHIAVHVPPSSGRVKPQTAAAAATREGLGLKLFRYFRASSKAVCQSIGNNVLSCSGQFGGVATKQARVVTFQAGVDKCNKQAHRELVRSMAAGIMQLRPKRTALHRHMLAMCSTQA